MEILTPAIQKYSFNLQSLTQIKETSNIADLNISNIIKILEKANEKGNSSMKDIYHTEIEIRSTQNTKPRIA